MRKWEQRPEGTTPGEPEENLDKGKGEGGAFSFSFLLPLVRDAGVKNLDATSTLAEAEAGPKLMLGSAYTVNCKLYYLISLV